MVCHMLQLLVVFGSSDLLPYADMCSSSGTIDNKHYAPRSSSTDSKNSCAISKYNSFSLVFFWPNIWTLRSSSYKYVRPSPRFLTICHSHSWQEQNESRIPPVRRPLFSNPFFNYPHSEKAGFLSLKLIEPGRLEDHN